MNQNGVPFFKMVFFAIVFIQCQSLSMRVVPPAQDLHTYSKPSEALITHLDLDLVIDFEKRILWGSASYDLRTDSMAKRIILDVNGPQIDSVLLWEGNEARNAEFRLGTFQEFLGTPLEIDLTSNSKRISVFYHTLPDAAALQWLLPEQTSGKKSPFLFTQGQAILTRSWIPIQDSPGIRFTYNAKVAVPQGMLAVMSASNPQILQPDGVYTFTMDQPIPAYLMALAAGNLVFRPISDRSGVYAEPEVADQAANEFADLEKMIMATEALYGPYRWDRYDVLVLPPSFPMGGMENPRLTFATPTIIAGDRSLTSLIAHELAHSWSGNLVTNATWNDFWINEGFTVYLERRIMEALYGKEYADMLALLGFQDLEKTISDLGDSSIDTHLHLKLENRDPDDGFTDIAYEKGYLLLRTLEEKVGREKFDTFLKTYFETHPFQSISTTQWAAYTQFHLLDQNRIRFDLDPWLEGPGIPSGHSVISSGKFTQVDEHLREFVRLGRLDRSDTRNWSTHEWLHFIRHLPTDLHVSFYEKLDEIYHFSDTGNAEILAAWLELSIKNGFVIGHNEVQLRNFLTTVGRRKFLLPLYRALLETNRRDIAWEVYLEAKSGYHSMVTKALDDLFNVTPVM